ncbi:MAG TPA: M23 family metallopeptidase, partial [Actinoplanes sp.]|nr:M23 family metallopeptidase [Actinoplanes sp.]
YGQAYAVDMLMPSPDAATKISWSFTTRDPSSYPCFGAPVLAMAAGRVVRATGGQRDHRSRDTWPALIWMMTAEGLARELAGAHRILGNRVIIEHDDGTYAVYAHLRQSSLTVAEGDRVTEGQQLAEVGNTGNTSEPHLHVQLVDSPHPTATAGIPMHWPTLHVLADKAPRWTTGDPKPSALPGYLESGHVFETHPAHTAPGTP